MRSVGSLKPLNPFKNPDLACCLLFWLRPRARTEYVQISAYLLTRVKKNKEDGRHFQSIKIRPFHVLKELKITQQQQRA